MPSPRRFKAALTWVPTNLVSLVTNTDNPFWDRIRADDLTRFSHAGPPHELVFKDLRERSDDIDFRSGVVGDLKKNTAINLRKTKLQNVSFARDG